MDESQTTRLFELCDSDAKGYLTREDLKMACPQLSTNEIGFIFSCLDTNNSGTIEKSEFVTGFEETLCKGESRGFGGIQERANQGGGGRPSSSTVVIFTNGYDDDEDTFNSGGTQPLLIAPQRPSPARQANHLLQASATDDDLVFDENEEDDYRKRIRSHSSSPLPGMFGKFEPMNSGTAGNGQLDYPGAEDNFSNELSPTTINYLSRKSNNQSLRSPKFLKRKQQPQFSVDIPCKDEVLQLYEELQSSGVPQIMNKFEEIVGNLCREIDQKREENKYLQNVQRTERDNYNKRMTEMENEMDQQLMMAEKKAREEERKQLTKEKLELKERLESEMHELQSNIDHLQKMEKVLRKESRGNAGEHSDELRHKLEYIARENRNLKNNLADNHLEMTLIKAELAELKSEFESKASSGMYETAENIYNVADTENMQRQLQLLYDANKRLHDTNDNLRGALDQRTSVIRQLNLAKQSGIQLEMNDIGSGPPIQGTAGTPTDPNSMVCLNADDDDRDSGFPHVRSVSSRTSISDVDMFRCASADINKESTSNCTSSLVEFCGPPDRTFRVVMCGDSSVGKSSIIMRIVKGIYQRNIASTLGVDFHVKCIKMGKTNVAVQLWDTAGQERFRSLCNSYFRRADGAILVYDVSVERSFLRIRDWIETVKSAYQDSVCKSIPILLVGNKIDLRRQVKNDDSGGGNDGVVVAVPESEPKAGESLAQIFDDGTPTSSFQSSACASGRQSAFGREATVSGGNFVSQKEGENVAKVLETEFIECSALDGTNIEAALLLLVGEMMKQEDIQIKNTTVELTKSGKKKTTSSCFSCRNS